MPDQKILAELILSALDGSSGPIKAREIVSVLKNKFGIVTTTTDVNSLLYGALAGRASKDADHRWSLNTKSTAKKADPKTATLPPSASPRLVPVAELNDDDGNGTVCPECGAPMLKRTARRGSNVGGEFFGCSRFPQCKAVLPIEEVAVDSANGITAESHVVQDNPSQSTTLIERGTTVQASQSELFIPPAEPAEGDSVPVCPKCSSPMHLRTARSGRNAGGQFYGCSQYPQCDGTLPIDGETSVAQRWSTDASSNPGEYPRRMSAFPNASTTQAVLLECTALPKAAYSAAAWDELSDEYRHSLSQWQLDLPSNPEKSGAPQITWLAIVEKILKRGRATTLSPTLEGHIRRLSTPALSEDDDWTKHLRDAATANRPSPSWKDGFDSSEEQLFFEKVLPVIGGPRIAGWVQRQVPLDDLAFVGDENRTDRRIDFLIAHPSSLRIAIEIDGAQHSGQAEADHARDAELVAAGYEVLRIPAAEVRNGSGEMLTALRNRLSAVSHNDTPSQQARYIALVRQGYQIQLALWHAIAVGLVPIDTKPIASVGISFDEVNRPNHPEDFVDAVLQDLNELIADVASLHQGEKSSLSFHRSQNPEFMIRFETDYKQVSQNEIYIRDVFVPVTVANEISAFASTSAVKVDQVVCERLLHRIFGYEKFREGQFEAISRCLSGQDAIVLLPTGAGKSIAFQMAAFLRPGVCIVVDPIVSLIEDQIENLHGFGIDRICQITSSLEWSGRKAVLELLARGEYLFCYVAPERFQDQRFRDSLRVLTTHTAVSLVAIDEAHCISEWGHDFRPAYLNIARISRDYCATDGIAPPLMALTGTASRAVLKDVQRELEISDFESIITPSTFDRGELHFRTIACRSSDKLLRLRGLLESLPRHFGHTPSSFFECRGANTHSGLIFCPHVEGGFGVVRVSEELSRTLNRRVAFYSGGSPKGVTEKDWQKQKTRIAQSFKRNQMPLMTATKAFGMGIDKPNIRYTVHFGIPASIEAFYQEAGRAGRDRRPAQCLVLHSNDAPERTRQVLNPSLSVEALHSQMQKVTWDNADDITRMLWFHTNSFAGIESDYEHVKQAIDEIGDIEQIRDVVVGFERDEKTPRERAIHRLLTIGVVSDYTVNHSAGQFHLRLTGNNAERIIECLYRYIAAYQRGQARVAVQRIRKHLELPHTKFVLAVARELIQFVYEVIERSRRQALSEMLALCEQCPDEDAIRKRLLTYLGTSGFTSAIDEILNSAEGGGLSEALEVLEGIRSAIDASQLRGESGRALESYPDHAGLRLVRGIAEAMALSPNLGTIAENVEACVRFAHDKYAVEADVIVRQVIAAIRLAADARPEMAQPIVEGLIRGADDSRSIARIVVKELPIRMSGEAVAALVTELNSKLAAFLEQ